MVSAVLYGGKSSYRYRLKDRVFNVFYRGGQEEDFGYFWGGRGDCFECLREL